MSGTRLTGSAVHPSCHVEMNERQKLGSKQGVWNDRLWVEKIFQRYPTAQPLHPPQ
jgi:hypothetical protein